MWTIGCGGILELIQLYTFAIYRAILRKVMPPERVAGRRALTADVNFGVPMPATQCFSSALENDCGHHGRQAAASSNTASANAASANAAAAAKSTAWTHASPLRILSVDGGGDKGLNAVAVLKALEHECGQPLNEMFDYVAGTSIGGCIACSVAKEAYSLDKAEDFMEQVA